MAVDKLKLNSSKKEFFGKCPSISITCAACGSSPQVHSISGLSLFWLFISESLFGVDDLESSRLL